MRRFITKNVEDMLAERIIADYERSITGVKLGYSTEKEGLYIETL